MARRASTVALVVLLASNACGDGGGRAQDAAAKDGGQDVATGQDGPAEASGDGAPDGAASCDPVKQNCAKAADDCFLVCAEGGFRCYLGSGATPRANGDKCTGDCGRGLICIGPVGSGVCRKYCATDADCPTGKTCTGEGPTCPSSGTTTYGRLCSV